MVSGDTAWERRQRAEWLCNRRRLCQTVIGQDTHDSVSIIAHRMTDTATCLAVNFHGNTGQLARLMIGGEITAEHRNPVVMRRYFGSKGFGDADRFMEAGDRGVPADVVDAGSLA